MAYKRPTDFDTAIQDAISVTHDHQDARDYGAISGHMLRAALRAGDTVASENARLVLTQEGYVTSDKTFRLPWRR